MTFRRSKKFLKQYAKLPASLRKKVQRCLGYMAEDIPHPGLQARKMVNEENIWEVRVDLHTRITFQVENNRIVLRAVGTHEVYRKP